MNLNQLFLIVSARWGLALSVTIFVVLATVAISLLLPKTYLASSQVIVNNRGTDVITGQAAPQQQAQAYMATQLGIIKSRNVALKVVDFLNLAESEKFRREFEEKRDGIGDIREWLADRLLKKLNLLASGDSGLVAIGVKWDDPVFAAEVANAFATQYQKTTIQIKNDPLAEIGEYFNGQIKQLRNDLEVAQNRLSQYQQDKGIVSVEARSDVEIMRLNELSTQLVAVQAQLMEANYRQQQATGKKAVDSPDVVSNQLIQSLKASLAQAEARLSQVDADLTPEHPAYRRAQAEVNRLRAEIARNIGIISNSIGSSASILRKREQELRESLTAQKERVLKLNRARDELAVLSHEAENAQRVYDAAMNRYSQINLEGHAKQTDVAILSRAVPPTEAASPKLLLNVLLSLFLGALAGVGIGFIMEMLNRKVRYAGDLVDALQSPIIGVMQWTAPPPRRLGVEPGHLSQPRLN